VLKIHVRLVSDFTRNDNQAGRRQGFACYPAVGIFLQTGIEDGIRNLVCNLIGVTFCHRFRRKEKTLIRQWRTPISSIAWVHDPEYFGGTQKCRASRAVYEDTNEARRNLLDLGRFLPLNGVIFAANTSKMSARFKPFSR
jgi:hypothetical protein